MKIALCLLSGILSVANIGAASAAPLTVKVTARVASLYDPGNALSGQVAIGQPVNGSYSYETTVPNQPTGWPPFGAESGEYPQTPTQGSVKFSAGSLVFAGDPTSPSWMFRVMVYANYNPGYQDSFSIRSYANKPLANGASVSNIDIDFYDMSGAALNSAALFTGAPDLAQFSYRTVNFSGYSAGGQFFMLGLQIEAVEAIDDRLVVSPASGIFIRAQHVDPALLLRPGGQATSVQASVNGIPLQPEYLQQCQSAPPNAQGRPALYCPDINSFLPAGNAHVEWRVNLMDGSVLSNAVDWEMLQ